MAIKATDTSTTNHPELTLVIDNGDLEALKTALNKTRFVNEEALVRYLLVAMLQTEDTRLYIKQNGETLILKPNKDLVKSTPES